MSFAYPYAFVVFLVFVCAHIFMRKIPTLVANARMMSTSYDLARTREILKFSSIFLIVFALAAPHKEFEKFPIIKIQSKIALVIDVSYSMDSTPLDLYGKTRLEVLKDLSKEFIAKNPYDSMLVVAFGENSLILNALNTDKQYLDFIIDSLHIGMAGGKTAINDALMRTISTLVPDSKPTDSASILLLTDGFDTDSVANSGEVVALAQQKNVKIYSVGIGEGADYQSLEFIAKSTLARAFLAKDSRELATIYDELNTLIPHSVIEPYRHWFVALPLGLGILGLVVFWIIFFGRDFFSTKH